jgi:hypothetical protein
MIFLLNLKEDRSYALKSNLWLNVSKDLGLANQYKILSIIFPLSKEINTCRISLKIYFK